MENNTMKRRDFLANLPELHARLIRVIKDFPCKGIDHIKEIGISQKIFYDFLRDPYIRISHTGTLNKIMNYVVLREKQIEALAKIKESEKI